GPLAPGLGEGHPQRLVDVGQVGDSDAADLLPAELDLGVAVQGGASADPHGGIVSPCLHEQLEHGHRVPPDALVTLDLDVVLLLCGALLDHGDVHCSGDAAEEVLVAVLVRLLVYDDTHDIFISTLLWSMLSVVGMLALSPVY